MEFQIIDVLRFKRKSEKNNTYKRTKGREFSVISCRLSGSTTFTCGGVTVTASPCDYLIIPENTEYTQKNSNEEVICIHLAFDRPFFDMLTSLHMPSMLLTQRFIELYECWQQKRSGFMFRCKALVYEILYQLFSVADDDAVSPAVEYMKQNFTSPDFSLSAAIAKTHLSPAYFRRLFKVNYGMTPHRYLTYLRINRAKSLLEGSFYTLSQISALCGFSDEKYFYSVFKKQTGTTPTRWRNGTMTQLEKCIEKYINDGLIEHIAVRVGRGDDIVFERYVGADSSTLFDMASVTKILATTTLTLIAIDNGALSLCDSVSRFFETSRDVKIQNLMTHTFGIGHKALNSAGNTYGSIHDFILNIPPDIPVGTDVLYSCPAYVLMGKILEKIYGMPLDAAFKKYVTDPLGMSYTAFGPVTGDVVNANKRDNERGTVNDYNCRFLGGVCGNAGVFSNMTDMTKYVGLMLAHGAPLVTNATFDNAVINHTQGMSESRGIGFLVVDERYKQTGTLFAPGAVGHCGHTGQSVFVDINSGLYAIVLSDATKHAPDYDTVKKIREDIHNAIANDIST